MCQRRLHGQPTKYSAQSLTRPGGFHKYLYGCCARVACARACVRAYWCIGNARRFNTYPPRRAHVSRILARCDFLLYSHLRGGVPCLPIPTPQHASARQPHPPIILVTSPCVTPRAHTHVPHSRGLTPLHTHSYACGAFIAGGTGGTMAYQVRQGATPHFTTSIPEPFESIPTSSRPTTYHIPRLPRTPTLRPTRPSDKKRLRCARRVVPTSRS